MYTNLKFPKNILDFCHDRNSADWTRKGGANACRRCNWCAAATQLGTRVSCPLGSYTRCMPLEGAKFLPTTRTRRRQPSSKVRVPKHKIPSLLSFRPSTRARFNFVGFRGPCPLTPPRACAMADVAQRDTPPEVQPQPDLPPSAPPVQLVKPAQPPSSPPPQHQSSVPPLEPLLPPPPPPAATVRVEDVIVAAVPPIKPQSPVPPKLSERFSERPFEKSPAHTPSANADASPQPAGIRTPMSLPDNRQARNQSSR